MHRFLFVCLLAILAALPHLLAAPVPKRTNAKPAVINAVTEQHVQWVQLRLTSFAHIAVLRDQKVVELAIVRRYLRDPKDTKELIAWLEKNFHIEKVKDKNLLRISFLDGNAKEQAAIINVVVDYFLKNDVEPRKDLKRVEMTRRRLADPDYRRKRTAEQLGKMEEGIKQREEYIRTLPALVEHAKAP